ncbi:MAG TPA: glycosyltransferase family 39 protein [Candidatus Binataceae bacterium]|nr:glycosyltransferase family 39 protein [Candidatus Binataceae bacterium]
MISPLIPHTVEDRVTAGSSARGELAAAIAVAIVAGMLCFYHLGAYGLWEPDEARYAEIAREMIVLHDFVTPHLNFVPYVEKPPLLYWLTALAMRLCGVDEFAARLTNAAAAMVGIGAVYFFARRVFSARQGILAATILATSALYALMAQVLTTDMLLTATLSVALFAFYLQWSSGGAWWWLMYVAMALGVLTKGPIAIAIPILAGGIFLLTEGEWYGAIRRFHVVPGLGVIALIAAPWFVAITIRQPDFFAFYVVGEHLERFFQSSYSHGQPLYYYVPVMLAGMLPWSLLVPFIPWRTLQPDPARRFCLIAATTVFVLFSMANAKLIPYILPAMPFVAIVIANGLDEFVAGRDCRRLAVVGPMLGIIAAGVLTVAAFADRFASPNPAMVQPALHAAGLVLIVASMLCFATFWGRRTVTGIATLALATAALLIVAGYGRLLAEPARSYAQLARLIAQRAPDARLICYPRYIQSLPFYTGRRVILVGAPTELAYGAAHASDGPNYFFTRRADLLRLWNEPQPSLLIVDRGAMPALAKSLGAFTIIAEDHKKIAVMRTPAAGMERPTPGD